jgi:hypothetical protein
MDTRTGIIAGAVTLIAAALSSLTTWLVSRRPSKAAEVQAGAAEVVAEAAWQTAMNDGFAKLATQAAARNEELVAEVGQLRGDIANLAQHVEGLENILRANGLPIPKRPVPVNMDGFTVLRGKPS